MTPASFLGKRLAGGAIAMQIGPDVRLVVGMPACLSARAALRDFTTCPRTSLPPSWGGGWLVQDLDDERRLFP